MNGYPIVSQVEQVANLPLTLYQPQQLPSPPSPPPSQPAQQFPQLPQPGVVTVVRDVEEKPEYNELAVGTNLSKAPRNWLTDDKRVCK